MMIFESTGYYLFALGLKKPICNPPSIPYLVSEISTLDFSKILFRLDSVDPNHL